MWCSRVHLDAVCCLAGYRIAVIIVVDFILDSDELQPIPGASSSGNVLYAQISIITASVLFLSHLIIL